MAEVNTDTFKVSFSTSEKIKCLEEILSKIGKILYVYDKSQEQDSKYNYKIFCNGILLYVASSNEILDGELIDVIVSLNAIITNDFEKPVIKRLVFESKNKLEKMLDDYRNML